MSRLSRLEVLDLFYLYYSSTTTFPPFLLKEDELFENPVGLFKTVMGLIRVERAHRQCRADPERLLLKGLVEWVSVLEKRISREEREEEERESKYTWTAEIISPGSERKYQWSLVAEGKKKRKYKWTAENKWCGDHSKKYTFEVSNAEKKNKEKKDEKKDLNGAHLRVVADGD